MNKLSGLEQFWTLWFIGPGKDPTIRRELGHTIGAMREERPRFTRNKILDHILAVPEIRRLYGHENIYISIAYYDVEGRVKGYRELYYDFDCETNPELAKRKALEFAKSVKTRYGADPIVYWTGG